MSYDLGEASYLCLIKNKRISSNLSDGVQNESPQPVDPMNFRSLYKVPELRKGFGSFIFKIRQQKLELFH